MQAALWRGRKQKIKKVMRCLVARTAAASTSSYSFVITWVTTNAIHWQLLFCCLVLLTAPWTALMPLLQAHQLPEAWHILCTS
jgi:hypothetical protein